MRYKVERVPFYRVVDTEAAEDAPVSTHYVGADREFAEQLAGDMNTNHQNALDAVERIQQEAREEASRVALEIAEQGRGEDAQQ
jgi:hypothetical protein